MKTIVNTLETVKEFLTDLSKEEKVNIHNEYCRENNLGDDEIYSNDEDFFNLFFEGKVIEAVRAVSYGKFNYSDDYVKFNGYGNLESFNYPDDEIDINAIAEDIIENPNRYSNYVELEEAEETDI